MVRLILHDFPPLEIKEKVAVVRQAKYALYECAVKLIAPLRRAKSDCEKRDILGKGGSLHCCVRATQVCQHVRDKRERVAVQQGRRLLTNTPVFFCCSRVEATY